jgi:redox-sensitive bicupin YhaK (pirin superfamily)
MNLGESTLRFLQIWIIPDKQGYQPNYGDYRFDFEERRDRWLTIATCVNNAKSAAPIKIHQDINLYATLVSAGKSIDFEVAIGRQAYLVLIEGDALVKTKYGEIALGGGDAAEIIDEPITLEAQSEAHALLIEMKKP